MERRKAMAYAATSALVLSSGLVAGAAVGGFNVLGFRGQFSSVIAGAEGTTTTTAATSSEQVTTPPPIYVTTYSIVDDYVVVTTATAPGAAPAVAPAVAAASARPAGASAASAPAAAPTTPVTQAASSDYSSYPWFDVAPIDDYPAPSPTTNAPYQSTSTTSSTSSRPDRCQEDDGHCDDDD